MTCNCPVHLRVRGEPRRQPVAPAPFPGSTIKDRFDDWQDALRNSSCTFTCGAARDDVCLCRCRGLFHNAGHDYWALQPRETLTVLPGGSTIRHINTHAPA